MAENNPKTPTVEQLQEEIARLKSAQADLEARALKAEAELEKAAATGKPVAQKVKGKVTLTLQSVDGEVQKTVGFKPGHVKVRTLAGDVVSSEAVLSIANGKEPSADEILKFPALAQLNAQQAKDLLAHLVSIEAAAITIQ